MGKVSLVEIISSFLTGTESVLIKNAERNQNLCYCGKTEETEV